MKLVIDTDILLSNIMEAFVSLDTAVGSLPAWEIDLSALEVTLQELALSIRESVDLVKSILPFHSEAPVLIHPSCNERHHLLQTLLIMTIHFRSNYRDNNSSQYKSLNYSPANRTLWI